MYRFSRLFALCALFACVLCSVEMQAQRRAKSKSAKQSPQTQQSPPSPLLSQPLFATTMFRDSSLTKQWKKVDSCMERGLPKSALEIVEKILTEAQKTKNLTHIVKALLHKSVLQAETRENGETTFVNEIQTAIAELEKRTSSAPPLSSENVVSAALLRSALADYYWLYFQQNRWKIQNRTTTQDSAADYRAWDTRRFIATIRELHFAALRNTDILQKTPVNALETVLQKGDSASASLRPTLYDLLAHRALAVLNNTSTSLPTPEEEFELSIGVGFTTIQGYTIQALSTPDVNDWKYRTVLLYREIMSFHANDASPDALLDVNRLRLQFAKNHAFGEDVEGAYILALERDALAFASSAIAAEYWCDIAEVYHAKGDYIKARGYCAKAMAYKNSLGSQRATALDGQILAKELTIQTEKTVLPNAPFLASVSFRNIDKVYFRLVKLPKRDNNNDGYEEERYYDDAGLKRLLAQKPIAAWLETMPLKDSSGVVDFKQHRVDVKVPIKPDSLPFGRYLVLASATESFAMENNRIAWTIFRATRLSLLCNPPTLFVTDAATGDPLAGVKVRILRAEYDRVKNQYREQLVGELNTNNDGYCSIDNVPNIKELYSRDGIYTELLYGNDMLRDGTGIYYGYNGKLTPLNNVLIFTDRSLYRPGQTVYFKGIAFSSDRAKPDNTILSNHVCTIRFVDANERKISEQTFTSNEYGSFHGAFVIPLGVLNGQMKLRVDIGYSEASFRVEEYKRPKFEAKLEQVKNIFRVGETIRIRGNARNYAGSVVDGAMVQYRVVREARFPYWRGWWLPVPQNTQKAITTGRVKTDAKGEFTIEFPAVPDKAFSPKMLPVFTYTVYADITDVSGETHSAQSVISVGYVGASLQLTVPERIERKLLQTGNNINIQVKNLNNEPLSTQGTVRVERLQVPQRIVRDRILPQADRYILSEQEFLSAFPHDIYANEDKQELWRVEKELLITNFKTDANGSYMLASEQIRTLEAGLYRIRAEMTDISGIKLEQFRFLVVFDSSSNKPAIVTSLDVLPMKTICQPSEITSILLSTSYPKAAILYRLQYLGLLPDSMTDRPKHEWLSVAHEQRRITIPVPDNFRGTITAQFLLVHDYRLEQKTVSIIVPWTNKKLRVEKSTFRDKTRPGSKEEWKFTIRGEKADALNAELVATLYDASLDALVKNDYIFNKWEQSWNPSVWHLAYSTDLLNSRTFGISAISIRDFNINTQYYSNGRTYSELQFGILQSILYGFGNGYGRNSRVFKSGRARTASVDADMEMMSAAEAPQMAAAPAPPPAEPPEGMSMGRASGKKPAPANPEDLLETKEQKLNKPADLSSIQARTNLNETTFFMPQMQTNEKGEVVLKFTMPEALTRWRMLAFAHTPDMKTGSLEAETITQKELMLLPNMPRFVREGDAITLPVKIANLTDKQISGVAELKLFDALTMQELPISLGFKQQAFTAEAAQSSVVAWSVTIPEGLQAVVYRVVAKGSNAAGEFSDGEEAPVPVLPNRMLVTETLPLNIRGNSSKTFELKKLVESGKSTTLRHQRLTWEMTSNPAWYAIQALPMMMEYPYECTEQLWNRLYANSIATHLANSKPRIKAVFESWKNSKESLLSNLEKNQELKAVLLEETPWVLNANDETERKRRVGLLFDLNRMSAEAQRAMQKLQERQLPNGGFTWFPGMPPSRFITQYLVSGIGHLGKLGVVGGKTLPNEIASSFQGMAARGVDFIDQEIAEEYRKLKEQRTFKASDQHLSYDAIQYLYARSFFVEKPIPSGTKEAFDFWTAQVAKYWTTQGLMGQSMIALALKRFTVADRLVDKTSKQAVPEQILKSMRERALKSEEMGMYWKQDAGWWWWQAPVETQALCIEAFIEVGGNEAAFGEVEDMKIWLLKQKQTQDWKTTKATAEACYALLLRGADWLESTKLVEVKLGTQTIDQKAIIAQGASIEAGTGYYKVSFGKGEIVPEMGKISLTKSDAGIAWGGVYWQYFERLDKITPAKTPLSIDKKLYRQNTTAKGLELEPITDKTALRVGDLVKVRVEIRADREMEYIHLKDMRGAGFEPITVLSAYKYQGGLGYYETMRDASANFFIGWLPRGVWVFEYALRVTHEGTFQNGITTIQSMYAPEFSSHSEGVTVRVGK